MTRATRPARTGTARPSARKARGRPLSYMWQKYASARPVAGKTPCLNPGWMFAMELTPDLGAARCRANGRRYHRAGQHRLPTASTDAFWASSGLISGAGATGNSRATLPVVAMPAGRKVGAHNCRSSCKPGEAPVNPRAGQSRSFNGQGSCRVGYSHCRRGLLRQK
jgi:hypothetical protein